MTWFVFGSCGMVRVSQAWFEFEIGTTERVRHASRGSIVALIMVWFVLATPSMVRVKHGSFVLSSWYGSSWPLLTWFESAILSSLGLNLALLMT